MTSPTLRILKYPLNLTGETVIQTKAFGRALAVGFQDEQLVMWVEAIPGVGDQRIFWAAMTGEDAPPDSSYLGTASLRAGRPDLPFFVVHVYGVES